MTPCEDEDIWVICERMALEQALEPIYNYRIRCGRCGLVHVTDYDSSRYTTRRLIAEIGWRATFPTLPGTDKRRTLILCPECARQERDADGRQPQEAEEA